MHQSLGDWLFDKKSLIESELQRACRSLFALLIYWVINSWPPTTWSLMAAWEDLLGSNALLFRFQVMSYKTELEIYPHDANALKLVVSPPPKALRKTFIWGDLWQTPKWGCTWKMLQDASSKELLVCRNCWRNLQKSSWITETMALCKFPRSHERHDQQCPAKCLPVLFVSISTHGRGVPGVHRWCARTDYVCR